MNNTSPAKTMDAQGAPAQTMGVYLPGALVELINADAASEDRSESRIVRRILEKHYAKRLKAVAQPRQRRAA